MFPFIFERLFSTYLVMTHQLKYLGYKHAEDEIIQACLIKNEVIAYKKFSKPIDKLDEEDDKEKIVRNISNGLLSFFRMSCMKI